MDSYSKRKVLEIPNTNEKHVIASQKISFLKPATNYLRFFRIEHWSRDILRDLLTKYLYFEMLMTMSSSSVPKI